jgi:hypothetical protein
VRIISESKEVLELLPTFRHSLKLNNRWCDETRWDIQNWYTKLVGGRHTKQMLRMLIELLALGEELAFDLYEAPSYYRRLQASTNQQSEAEAALHRGFLERGVLITAMSQPSVGKLGHRNAIQMHNSVSPIGAKIREYNQKLREIEDWRSDGLWLRPIRMWIAGLPSRRHLPRPLPLH